MMNFTHNTFISPFTWRYGSEDMRHIWSESYKRHLMRQVWVALAEAQYHAGIVSFAQLADLKNHMKDVDIPRALEIEKETRHDVMAEIRCFAEQCSIGGGIIHWGATSADINDNVNSLRLRESVNLILIQLKTLLAHLADKIEETANIPIMAYTHIQPAEPTTLGYRFAFYAQDLLVNYETGQQLASTIKGKGFKGAVGTQASFVEILAHANLSPTEMEAKAMALLDLPYYLITTQTISRQQDLSIQQWLTCLAGIFHKMALDFRILQSPPFGEWHEPFAKKQVGSSAMPFKRNPIHMENVCSLARYVASLSSVAWDNMSQAILERSLDDSANRRLFQPEAFLATDEMLQRMNYIVAGMVFNHTAMQRNLTIYGPFSATERILMALVQAGVNRQEAHEWLREHSLVAWQTMQETGHNPLLDQLLTDERLTEKLPANTIRQLMSVDSHTGTAPIRAQQFAQHIRQVILGKIATQR